ncbi:MAG: L,D-transpeptidase family protein [Pseudolabrys sp.]|nr:L,D-transpeptidase family protein [Pseudolabrys sp.]
MMIRRFGPLLLTLPVAVALPLVSAQAQSSPPPGYYRSAPSSAAILAEEEDLRVERPRRDPLSRLFSPQAQAQPQEQQPLPPPGLAAPQGQNYGNPQYYGPPPGHPMAQPDPNAVRPPGVVGGAPAYSQQQGGQPLPPQTVMTLPPEDQPEQGQPKELPEHLKKQLVDYSTKEPAGTIIVDTANTYLYLVLGGGKAMRYGIGVGREGFTWAGTERISRMREWPDWHPPAEMIERQPYLPRMMAGGPGNPMGARALYLGKTLYRIHGTNQPSTIGSYVSSGCIRLLNEDIEDLYSRVQNGSRVVVLPGKPPETVASTGLPPEPANPMAPPPRTGANAGVPMQTVGEPISIAAPPPAGGLPPISSSALPPPIR